ncbi:DUF4157 domain-containing protein [Undibacterium amnicola]|uniref:eCIS core domain-containing protein n=1 Tax=Undibacterium amnicola TaxID=1834038 RepID=UPI001FE5FB0A|nr:DUF4157 domain-containing protein [Undibacterium amnicola]
MRTRSSLQAEQVPSHHATHSTQFKSSAKQVLDARDIQSVQRKAQDTASHSSAVSQLKLLQAKMAAKADVAQRVEDEEPVQAKFDAVQRVEEEEPVQGKFDAVQRVEDEEPVQGKFDAVQRVEDEEPVQGKFAAVQRVEEEEPIQGKFAVAQRLEDEEPAQAKFGTAQLEERVQPNNTGLPNQLKAGIESLSGMSMDHVKVHYNSSQPAQLNAHAYAQGSEIHVAPGQEQHLPHEAWHVVQQAQGRVRPTTQMKQGVPVNDDAGLESEADVMGDKAMQLKSYDGSVKIKTVITAPDLNDWNLVRSKLDGVAKGGEAYEIGSRVDASLGKLGLNTGESAMSAHMIPNRIGGSGKAINVRPWKQSFESGTWEKSVEEKFNQELLSAKVGDVVPYTVNTTEISNDKVNEIIATSAVDTEKNKPEHKTRLLEIPVDVSATVGSKSLGTTDEPFKGLIKGY